MPHVHLAGGERGVDARTEWSGRLLGASLTVHQRSVTTVVAALVVGTIVIGCLTLAVLHARLKRRRPDRGGPRAITVGGHTDDDVLQVIVVVRDQEAELEIQLDGFETYGELRELVVDAVPQMFKPDDALLMEYADRGGWTRVKTKTPVDVVKNARSVRIKCEADKISKKIARRAREDHFELGMRLPGTQLTRESARCRSQEGRHGVEQHRQWRLSTCELRGALIDLGARGGGVWCHQGLHKRRPKGRPVCRSERSPAMRGGPAVAVLSARSLHIPIRSLAPFPRRT